MKIQTRNRELWADIVRIIAIFFVLVIHSSTPITEFTLNNFTSFVLFAIAKTGVPMFVMLSGGLLLGKSETYKSFYTKRFLRIFSPWIFWSTVWTVWTLIQNHGLESFYFHTFLRSTWLTMISLWYVPMILGLYIITPVLRKCIAVLQTREILLFIFLWFISLSVLPFFINSAAFPLYTDNGIVRQVLLYGGYYLLGYLLVEKNVALKLVPSWVFTLIMSSSIILSAYFALSLSSRNGSLVSYPMEYLSPGIIIASITLFLLLINISQNIIYNLPSAAKYVIDDVSSTSFGIFLSHLLFSAVFIRLLVLESTNIFHGYINGLILFSISYLIIFSLQKIPILKHMVS